MKWLIWNGPRTYWMFETDEEMKQFLDRFGNPGPGEQIYKLEKKSLEEAEREIKR